MTKEEVLHIVEQEIKEHLKLVFPGELEVLTYGDLESAMSHNGLNVKGNGWELEISIFAKK